jgi:hypothetical protein
MRLLAKFTDKTSGSFSKVYRNVEWNEYVVKFYDAAGTHMDASDYFTSDKSDAMETAGHGKEGIEAF